MSRIELIGINADQLDPRQEELVTACRAVVASRRFSPLVAELGLAVIPIAPIREMVAEVELALEQGDVAILASGDPLFFGIGRTLLGHFPAEQLRIHPALSAVQLACSRLKVPWDDLSLLSLHGRDSRQAAARILARAKTMVFTDRNNSPDGIARLLLEALEAAGEPERAGAIRMRVAENLGLPEEQLHDRPLAELAEQRFAPLNMVLVEQPLVEQEGRFGLTAEEIHHSRGLITKDEVRAASLHKMRLPNRGVLWDIGGGSGSVSLEAARLNPELSVYTIEKKPEEQENIRSNIRRYRTYNIRLIGGEAPEALAQLPAPDRVFIGGSGSRLREIIELIAPRLQPGGRVVINAVLAGTAELAPSLLLEQGYEVETTTIAVTRKTVQEQEATSFNPITIITGCS
ncbi:precorrin-6y C5,15-methyltransferase (decarboxylating) subunit CbiE [Desulfogranum mediterraneum]|uniref:precorrin-6y C5,15-methyltransferase (decarboxylating) subunit CbiE n=1 Tax=Desulfogranum mediterraneum TaxID=160661 RepID=UPI000427D138|nr:precorrin-6y C5,15-methyltransferase (decarboxylating) subunit CbiE [Desulfogranum mediterraneum]